METESKRAESRGRAVLAGAGAGLVAYVVGYVLTFVLVRGEVRRQFEGELPAWKVVGWYFYNAHLVDVVSSQSVGPFGGSDAVNLIAESSGTTATVLYVVPPLVLLLAGGAVAWRLGAADPRTAAVGGAATVAGYLVLAVLGALLFPHALSGSFLGIDVSATIRVPLGPALVVAGLLYPAAFGTTGAVLGSVLRDRDAAGDPAGS